MTSRNEKAEDLLRNIGTFIFNLRLSYHLPIEREEEEESLREPDKHLYHLCIVNLVIGTLYCSKVHHPIDRFHFIRP